MFLFAELRYVQQDNWTYSAHETVAVPIVFPGRKKITVDRSTTSAAFRCKQSEVIFLTVRLTIFFVEPFLVECSSTCSASEMLWMPGFVHCIDALLQNWILHYSEQSLHFIIQIFCVVKCHLFNGSIAISAPREKRIKIIVFTIYFPRPFVEVSMPQFITAFGACKMFRMPNVSSSDDYLKSFP